MQLVLTLPPSISPPLSCDADPAALAKYVVALLRKDKPKSALKELCVDQLEVFLSKGEGMRKGGWKEGGGEECKIVLQAGLFLM